MDELSIIGAFLLVIALGLFVGCKIDSRKTGGQLPPNDDEKKADTGGQLPTDDDE
tara:strand:+ start:118 stop:282 length:165 start_codon:yes stop_codon:yes gene_type:complete